MCTIYASGVASKVRDRSEELARAIPCNACTALPQIALSLAMTWQNSTMLLYYPLYNPGELCQVFNSHAKLVRDIGQCLGGVAIQQSWM
jgi:hypothetical protein